MRHRRFLHLPRRVSRSIPTRLPRSVKRRTEEHSPSYTTTAGNRDEITPNAGNNNVDATKEDRGNDRMISALQRFAADISFGRSSHNLTRDELMDLVYARFDKIDAEQSRKAAREAMEIERQIPAKNDNAGSSASGSDNATKSVPGKRSTPGPALVSVPRPEPTIPRVPASKPIEEARRVPLPVSPKAPENPEKKTIAGSSAMRMARMRQLRKRTLPQRSQRRRSELRRSPQSRWIHLKISGYPTSARA